MDKEKNKIEEKNPLDIPAKEIKTEKEATYPDEIDKLKTQLQEKENEAKAALDRLLRVRAAFDNYQKRPKKERNEFEKSASETGEVAPLVKEIKMTRKQFKGTLKNAG